MNSTFSNKQKTAIILGLGIPFIFSATTILLLNLGVDKILEQPKIQSSSELEGSNEEFSLNDRIPEEQKETLKEDSQKKLVVYFDMTNRIFKYELQGPNSGTGGLSIAKKVTDSKMMPDQAPNACLSGLLLAAISAEAMPELQRKYAPKDKWGTFAFMSPIAKNAVKQPPVAKMTSYSEVREYCQKNASDIFNANPK